MKKEEAKKYFNKKVRIVMKNNFRYHGIIQKVNDDSLVLKDKFSMDILISLDSISLIMDHKGDNNNAKQWNPNNRNRRLLFE